jgi:hypothetical protein
MIEVTDYIKLIDLNTYLQDSQSELYISAELKEQVLAFNIDTIYHDTNNVLSQLQLPIDLRAEISDSDSLMWLYVHFYLKEREIETPLETLTVLEDFAPSDYSTACWCFKKTGWQYVLLNNLATWDDITKNVDPTNWKQIEAAAAALPLAGITLNEVCDFLSPIVQHNANDGALPTLYLPIENWIQLTPYAASEVQNELTNLTHLRYINFYLRCFVKGLQKKHRLSFAFFVQQLENDIKPENAFQIFMSLDYLGLDEQQKQGPFYSLLITKYKTNKLSAGDLITIANICAIYRQEVFDIIKEEMQKDNQPQATIMSIARYMHNVSADLDPDWYHSTLLLILVKMDTILSPIQTSLLKAVSDKNLQLAYELFLHRLQVMGGNEFLEEALAEMARKNPHLFQQKFIEWLLSDDPHVHIGLRHVCSSSRMGSNLFYVDAHIFRSLSEGDRIYAAYKIVGYIYSMEKLQLLLISLAVSIDGQSECLWDCLLFIFSKYLVYNYRSTLTLLRKEREKQKLSSFANRLFNTIIDEYEYYSAALNSIPVYKELKPYPKQIQLRQFYYSRAFEDLPKKVRQESVMSLFKGVTVNANKWAIRRPGESRHTPQPLGTVSVSHEFPSGETLDPVFQEEIRRTYQNIRKNEIGTN